MATLGRLLPGTVVLLLAIAPAGCDRPMTDDQLRANAQEQVKLVKDLTSVLDTIRDVESAQAAKPRLAKLRSQLVEFMSEVKNHSGDRTAHDLPEVLGTTHEEYVKATKQLCESYARVAANPELKNAIGDSFELRGLSSLGGGDLSVN